MRKKVSLSDQERRYAAAWESAAAKAWLASLTPEQREEAERAGLLSPRFESRRSGSQVSLIEGRTRVEVSRSRGASGADVELCVRMKSVVRVPGRFREACFSVLEGRKTLSAAAREGGISKQRLFYWVKNVKREMKQLARGGMNMPLFFACGC